MTDTGTEIDTEFEAAVAETWNRLVRGVRVALLVVASVVQWVIAFPTYLTTVGLRDTVWPDVVAFAVLAAVALVAAADLVTDRVARRSRTSRTTALACLCLGAGALASTSLPGEVALTAQNWSLGLVGWFLLALLVDRRTRTVVLFLAVHTALSVGVALSDQPVSAVWSAVVFAVPPIGLQVSIAFLARVFGGTVLEAVRAEVADEREESRDALAETAHRDVRRRYGALLATTAPLLRGIAEDRLDPAAPEVRRRCSVEVARMRRLLTAQDDVGDRLVHELRACIDATERRGVSVALSVRGTGSDCPAAARAELVEAATEALASITDTARVTVVRSGRGVRVAVVGRRGPGPLPEDGSGTGTIEVTVTTGEQSVWLEGTWTRTR